MAEDLSECTSVVGLKDLPKVKYVERTHQSSPPPSPPRIKHEPEPLEVPGQSSATPTYRIHPGETFSQINGVHRPVSVATKVAFSPMSPCETHLFDGAWPESKKPPVSSLPYSGIPQQTDDAAQPLSKTNPSKRDGLQVPVAVSQMTIQPSTSRPSSITSCILPPGTKNAASQANSTWFGKDASVQTEEIRVDKRPVKLAVHLLPTHLNSLSEPSVPPKPFVAPAVSPKKSFKQQPHRGPRISMKIPPSSLPFQPMQSLTEASNPTNSRNDSFRDLGKMPLKPVPLPKPTLAPARSVVASNNSKGPLNRSAHFGVSLQNVASRQLAEINDASDDSDHEDGEAQDLAGSMPVLKTIRRFKGPDPSSVISDFAPGSLQRPNPTGSFDAVPTSSISSSRNHSQRGVGAKRSPSRSSSLLKTRSSSPSFGAITSSNFSTQSALPPQVIPKRSSSRIPMSTWGDGAQSPSPDSFATPGSSVLLSSHQRPGTMRKVQSPASIRGKAGNILPQKPRRRTQSPNVTPVDSITFESPERTDLPISELPSPLQQPVAFDWDNRQSTPSKRPETAASWAPQIEESQLVDSIAGTMAGEWMWKYMRKWRSLEMETAERFAARAGDESGGFTLASHGPRHKRWVWLSPYDRTIMWGKKQPTSGTAALGKESRKLAIQHVIDIADNTPMPKRPELAAAFHRSILIITPSRQLKLTAINAERHAHWMSALSFLVESDRLEIQLSPMPLVQPIADQSQNATAMMRQQSPSFGRSKLRDYIHLTKDRESNLPRSVSAQNQSAADSADIPSPSTHEQGADFPSIPRLYSHTNKHQREHSNTISFRLVSAFAGLRYSS